MNQALNGAPSTRVAPPATSLSTPSTAPAAPLAQPVQTTTCQSATGDTCSLSFTEDGQFGNLNGSRITTLNQPTDALNESNQRVTALQEALLVYNSALEARLTEFALLKTAFHEAQQGLIDREILTEEEVNSIAQALDIENSQPNLTSNIDKAKAVLTALQVIAEDDASKSTILENLTEARTSLVDTVNGYEIVSARLRATKDEHARTLDALNSQQSNFLQSSLWEKGKKLVMSGLDKIKNFFGNLSQGNEPSPSNTQ